MTSLQARVGFAVVEDLLARASASGVPAPRRSCHSVARAFARVVSLVPHAPKMLVVDGGFYSVVHEDPDWSPPDFSRTRVVRMAHSWLSVGGAIVDPYPLCVATGPLLVPPPVDAEGKMSMFWYGYHAGDKHFPDSAREIVSAGDFVATVDRIAAWLEPHAPFVRVEDLIRRIAMPCDVPK